MHNFLTHPILFSFIVSVMFHSQILLYHEIVVHLSKGNFLPSFFFFLILFFHSSLTLSFAFHLYPLESRHFIVRSLSFEIDFFIFFLSSNMK